MNASRPNPLAEISAALEEIAAGLDELRDALRRTNDPRLIDLFDAVLDVTTLVVSKHRDSPSETLADDLANLYSAVARANVRRVDPDLGETQAGVALRGARGNLLADISEALAAAKSIGLQPIDPRYLPPSSAVVQRAGFEDKLKTIEARLDEVADLLEEQIRPAGDKNSGASNLQISLVNFYVDSMKIEISMARFEAAIAQILDLAALARSVEALARLTYSFVATVKAVTSKFWKGLLRAADATVEPVRKLVRRVRGFIGQVRESQESILIAEVPRSGARWKQVNFDLATYRGFFGVPAGVAKEVTFEHVRLDGRVDPPERRQGVAVQSQNYRFEVGAASGLSYPVTGHPILIFDKISEAEFRYMLLMPGEEPHRRVQHYLDTKPSRGGKKRIVVTAGDLRKVWPECPLLR